MSDQVLVTGAAGFVGRHVAAACAAAGWHVTTLDIRAANEVVRSQPDFLHTDLSDPAILEMIRCGRFAAVLHQAGITSTTEEDWPLLERINVTGPLRLAVACAASGTRFIYASSHSVYGTIKQRALVPEDAGPGECSGPLNRYAKSKLELDRRMAELASGLEWISLRYTNVFGTGEEHKGRMASIISQLLRRAANGERIDLFANTLHACRDYIAVGVVADTCVKLITAQVRPGVYNLGSSVPVSFATLLEWCCDFADMPITVRLVPNPFTDRYQFWTSADTSKLRSVLPGWPAFELEDIRLAAKALFGVFQDGRP